MTISGLVRRDSLLPPGRASSHALPRVSHAPHETAAHATYYPWFDWLRIALASMVVLSHADLLPGESGNFAVQVFFALSGWLIGGILLRTPRAGMARFYYLRATRIWIPYAVAFAILLAVSLTRDVVTWKYLEFLFYKATFVYNLFGTPQLASASDQMPLRATGNHFWSICAEEQFYLFAPLLLVFLPKLGRKLWPWALLTLVPQYGSIAAGVLAAVTNERHPQFYEAPRARVLLALLAGASAAAITSGLAPYEPTVVPLAISIVLLLARRGPKQRVAAFLGGVSYPLYLNHWVGLFVAGGVAKRLAIPEPWATLLLGLPLAFAVSALLYLAVDRAILARRDAWYRPRLGREITFAAYALLVIGLVGGAAYQAREGARGELTAQRSE